MKISKSIQIKDLTIVGIVQVILTKEGRAMGPSEIAQQGIEMGLFKVPKLRTRAYLTQLIQSVLHNHSAYTKNPKVCRPIKGLYSLVKNR